MSQLPITAVCRAASRIKLDFSTVSREQLIDPKGKGQTGTVLEKAGLVAKSDVNGRWRSMLLKPQLCRAHYFVIDQAISHVAQSARTNQMVCRRPFLRLAI